MEWMDIFSFTFVSKKCTSLAKSAHCVVDEFRIEMRSAHVIEISIGTESASLEMTIQIPDEPTEIPPVSSLRITSSSGDRNFDLKLENTSVRAYLDYTQNVFRCQKLGVIMNQWIPFPMVQKILEGMNIDKFMVFDCDAQRHREIINGFPMVKELELRSCFRAAEDVVRELVFPKKMLRLSISFNNEMTLEDLLRCKALNLEIVSPGLSGADLNKFLKSWVESETNQDMESLIVMIRKTNLDANPISQVLDGIKYTEAPADLERKFYRNFGENHRFCIDKVDPRFKGGYDFERKDRKKATLISYESIGGLAVFKFMVWL